MSYPEIGPGQKHWHSGTEGAVSKTRCVVFCSIVCLLLGALGLGAAYYAGQSHKFLDRCQTAGPPAGTRESQASVSYRADLMRRELVCSWDDLPGSTPRRHSETTLPLFQ